MMENIHACALVVNGKGILILGKSGTGKSELALDLLDQCKLRGLNGYLIGDDRIILTQTLDGVWARVPEVLAGMIEVRGSGIHSIAYVPEAQMDFAVKLVDQQDVIRMPENSKQEIASGIFLPCLTLPKGNFSALRVILARLGHYGGVLPQE